MPITGLTPPFKTSWFFTAENFEPSAGWSENYWTQGTSYASVLTLLTSVAPKRMALLGTNIALQAVRVSYPGQKHQDQLYAPAALGLSSAFGVYTPTVGGSPSLATFPHISVILRVHDVNLFHTTLYLRGIPENVLESGTLNPDTFFSSAMSAWQTALNTFAMVKAPGSGSYSNITGVDYTEVSTHQTGRPSFERIGRRKI